ncbi:hypothetical protein pb186bvf_003076 [Paramecium bursaria]
MYLRSQFINFSFITLIVGSRSYQDKQLYKQHSESSKSITVFLKYQLQLMRL